MAACHEHRAASVSQGMEAKVLKHQAVCPFTRVIWSLNLNGLWFMLRERHEKRESDICDMRFSWDKLISSFLLLLDPI